MHCVPILTSMAQRSQRHPNTRADLKNAGEVGLKERLASPQAKGFQSSWWPLDLPTDWWWECVSPELGKPVCGDWFNGWSVVALGGQCHGAGKDLWGVELLGIPGFVWTLVSLHWSSAISSPKVGSGGAGGQAHGLPSSPKFSFEEENPNISLEGLLQTFNFPFSHQLCFIRLLDQSVSLKVINSGNKIQRDRGWTWASHSSMIAILSTWEFCITTGL